MIAATDERLVAAVRDSRATVLGYLASRSGGDLSAAEDALSEAVLAAVQQWPVNGIPQKPEAWLLQVARRRLLDEQRKHHVRERFAEPLRQAIELASATADREENFPDERLKLLFVCAHPAIDEAARTPLMLQVVLGLEAHDLFPDIFDFENYSAIGPERLRELQSSLQESRGVDMLSMPTVVSHPGQQASISIGNSNDAMLSLGLQADPVAEDGGYNLSLDLQRQE